MTWLTKVWFGRWWIYLDTRRPYHHRTWRVGPFYAGIISYRKSDEPV